MKAELKRVIESILTAEDEPATCQPHRPSISAYVEAELDDRDAGSLYPQLAEHLETCPDCYEEYRDLRQLLLLERQGKLVEPPRPGQFDFSFLEELAPQPSIWATTGTNVRRLVTGVTARLSTGLVSLSRLPETLTPYRRLAPAPVALRMKDIREPRPEDLREVLELPDHQHNIRIKLLMGPVQEGRGTVMVKIEDLEHLRPLPRVRVTLRDQEKHLLESSPTATDGTVTFKSLNIGQYVIEVRRDGTRWELPMTFQTQEVAPASWADLENRVRRFLYNIPVLALEELKQLGQLSPALQVAYAPAGWAVQRGEREEQEAVAFQVLDEEKGLRLDVQVAWVQPELVWLIVRPFALVAEGPAVGARISLCDPTGDPLEMRSVGSEGTVQFKDVSLDTTYYLRAEYRGQTWEVVLDVKSTEGRQE